MNVNYSTHDLKTASTHQEPMIWVDEVIKLTSQGGVCKIIVSNQKLYGLEGLITQGILVEWAAQAASFINLALIKSGIPGFHNSEKTYLVGLMNLEFKETDKIQFGSELLVSVELDRKIDSFYYLRAKIFNEPQLYFMGSLKIFAPRILDQYKLNQ